MELSTAPLPTTPLNKPPFDARRRLHLVVGSDKRLDGIDLVAVLSPHAREHVRIGRSNDRLQPAKKVFEPSVLEVEAGALLDKFGVQLTGARGTGLSEGDEARPELVGEDRGDVRVCQ